MGCVPSGILYNVALSGIALIAAALSAQAVSIGGFNGLTVNVSVDGSYEVVTPAPAWRFAGNIGSPLSNFSVQSGVDPAVGSYAEISFDAFTDAPRHAAIRSYFGSRTVLFSMSLPSGGPNTLAFPTLTSYPRAFRHLAFAGVFAYPSFYATDEESPWVAFDSSMNSVILSPASHFMVARTGLGPTGELLSGISLKITSLPAGFTQRTLLVLGNGINRTFDEWGRQLTGVTGKIRPPNDADVTLSRLGYWTDAGSTYYYSSEPGLSYPETLAAIKSEFASQGTALGYVQLDSWFYPKGPASDWREYGRGIYEYLAATPPFASSLAAFQRSLGIPLVTHSRWIDPQSPYRQMYRMSGNVSIDPLYWGEVARYLGNSGVASFEQDWLFDRASPDYNLTDGDEYLDHMAHAMERQNLTIQYCSGTARHFLQSTNYNNLTTIRASEDRFNPSRWTNFLYASRLASAVGVWPFTDVLMSSETDNLLIATLSAGPVGVGDRLGGVSGANLRYAARPDGVIVKPDVPLSPIDRSFWSDSQNERSPMIAATFSDFGDSKALYLFLYPQGEKTQAQFRLSDAGIKQPAYLYDYFAGAGRVVRPDELLTPDVSGTLYQIAAPIGLSGIALIGDTGHFASLGKQRVTELKDDGAVHVTVAFAAGETSRTLRGYSPDPPSASAVTGNASLVSHDRGTGLFTVEVAPGANGFASLRITRASPQLRRLPFIGNR